MSSYWDRFSKTYTQIGDADFWLKHRLRLIEGLDGRALKVCGGGRLVLEMLKRDIDAYGIDLSPKMIEQAKTKLADAGFDSGRASIADVTRLPFGDGDFDVVLSRCASSCRITAWLNLPAWNGHTRLKQPATCSPLQKTPCRIETKWHGKKRSSGFGWTRSRSLPGFKLTQPSDKETNRHEQQRRGQLYQFAWVGGQVIR
jgi:SAM-dependent methyltransferase